MKVTWNGQSFVPPGAVNLMAAMPIGEVVNVEGRDIPEPTRRLWSFVCPDCDKTIVFEPDKPDSHEC
ncbi:MAG: hypothetical protein WD904_03455 [Dehalococcoidia bacterium]